MAFVNTLFPNPRLIHDLQVGFARPNTIVGNSFSEYRISKQRNHRNTWTWPSRAMLSTDRTAIENFIKDTAQFSQNSFKFQAPNSSRWTLTPLQWAGSANLFKLTERGIDDHPVFHLHTNVSVAIGGVGAAFAARSIYNGIPVIAVTGASAASAVTISGTFFYAVRLNQADFAFGMTALDVTNRPYADTIGDISLIEVFEY